MEGYVTLREAAARIGRSTARTRQYVHSGQIAWKRDEMGHLMVEEASLGKFVPPERGEARAAGVSPNTQLRHARATKKLVSEVINEGPAKATTLQVLSALIAHLTDKVDEVGPEAETVAEDVEDVDDEEAPADAASFDNLLNKM